MTMPSDGSPAQCGPVVQGGGYRPPGAPGPFTPPRRSIRPVIILALVVLLVLAGGGLWLLLRDGGGGGSGPSSAPQKVVSAFLTAVRVPDVEAAKQLVCPSLRDSFDTDNGVRSTSGSESWSLIDTTEDEERTTIVGVRLKDGPTGISAEFDFRLENTDGRYLVCSITPRIRFGLPPT